MNSVTLNTAAHWLDKGGMAVNNVEALSAAAEMRSAWGQRALITVLRLELEDAGAADELADCFAKLTRFSARRKHLAAIKGSP